MTLSNLLNIALAILLGLSWYINESLMKDVEFYEMKLFLIRKKCNSYKNSDCEYCNNLANEIINEVDSEC